jgi:hypothetical protein
MSDDLVKRLRNLDTHPEGAPCKAANHIEELESKLAKAVGALQAFKDFDGLPLESKRPDVFEIKVRKPILDALTELKGEK